MLVHESDMTWWFVIYVRGSFGVTSQERYFVYFIVKCVVMSLVVLVEMYLDSCLGFALCMLPWTNMHIIIFKKSVVVISHYPLIIFIKEKKL